MSNSKKPTQPLLFNIPKDYEGKQKKKQWYYLESPDGNTCVFMGEKGFCFSSFNLQYDIPHLFSSHQAAKKAGMRLSKKFKAKQFPFSYPFEKL